MQLFDDISQIDDIRQITVYVTLEVKKDTPDTRYLTQISHTKLHISNLSGLIACLLAVSNLEFESKGCHETRPNQSI
jgi:hypothetical protein